MYNWKDTRNYRRFRDENGNVIANIIYVDGEEVAVSDEVYEAYASMDRRERYLEEQENELLFRYDPHGGDELYQTIVRLIGNETEMERLNTLFAERFLRVKPMDLYIQEYTQEFLYSLLYRDMQTDHTVLRLLLDRTEE